MSAKAIANHAHGGELGHEDRSDSGADAVTCPVGGDLEAFFYKVDVVGEPVRVRSNLVRGSVELAVVLHPLT
ncbi:MAG: hypothetical protein QF515_02745 [Pseudomonadales bacterium]|jgi:hypothetical protein|nr:hypothetical protein [Pseudomonadales bacterium]MDP6473212.1 hypothetical protein [Pseudomonadales bacterium]MDP6826028.1 hypothetical protein [Pseudomonadales bacterium]|tara:strand:- start:4045 stop:4260 length:216 start_codon:yes stop_codon:yes gene_type:complete